MASKRGKSAAGGTLDPEQGALRHQGMTPLPRDNMGSGMSGRDAGHKQKRFWCFMGRCKQMVECLSLDHILPSSFKIMENFKCTQT